MIGDILDTNAISWKTGSKVAILSRTGETWFEIDADRIGTLRKGRLVSLLKNGKRRLVDTAGQIMVEPQFDELTGFARDIAWPSATGAGAPSTGAEEWRQASPAPTLSPLTLTLDVAISRAGVEP
jgi:hypothetical protein